MNPETNQKKTNWQTFRDVIAVTLVVVAALVGLSGMLTAETMIKVDPETNMLLSGMLEGLKNYNAAIGLIFLLSGIAFVLVGYRDKTETSLTHPEKENE